MKSSRDDWLLKDRLLNWAGSHEFNIRSENLYLLDSIEQVQQLVKRVDKIRALGTRHCFHGEGGFIQMKLLLSLF